MAKKHTMTTQKFCEFGAQRLVRDFIEAGIIQEDEAFGVGFVIDGAMQAAAQHALIGVKKKLAGLLAGTSLMPEDDCTESDLIDYIKTMHPHA